MFATMFINEDIVYAAPDQFPQDVLQGGFARQVIVIFRREDMEEANLAFLTKLLAAARLHLEQDTLNGSLDAGAALSLAPFARQKQAGHVLAFGLSPAQLGLSVAYSPYIPFEFYGVNWIFCDSLSALEPDRAKKALLWQALQALFLQ